VTAAGFRLVDAALSDPGKVRAANEDSFHADADRGFWLVADGMGGHANGAWASQAIVEQLGRTSLSGLLTADVTMAAEALHAANARIFGEAQSSGRRMGSTAAVLLVSGGRFAALWVGDSRIYLLRGGALHQLTRDHTQVQEMVDRGLLTREEAANHPMSHVISRAVGVEAAMEVDVIVDDAAPGDVFMLCSDGLSGLVSSDEIAAAIGGKRPRRACEGLLATCLDRGAPDNVTVIVVACEPLTLRITSPLDRPHS
jgi:serine/threonine protein phosphatase PrpC